MTDTKDPLACLQDIEIKVAFLEDALSKLSDEFYIQQRELTVLKAKYNLLSEKVNINSEEDIGGSEILDERPPHY